MPTQHQVSQKEDKGKGASEYKYLVTSNRSSLLGVSERRALEVKYAEYQHMIVRDGSRQLVLLVATQPAVPRHNYLQLVSPSSKAVQTFL